MIIVAKAGAQFINTRWLRLDRNYPRSERRQCVGIIADIGPDIEAQVSWQNHLAVNTLPSPTIS
jgi:hypothetical protein